MSRPPSPARPRTRAYAKSALSRDPPEAARAYARRRIFKNDCPYGSHRRRGAVAADIDVGRRDGAVILLGAGDDEELRARLEIVLAARIEAHHRRRGRHDHLLLAVLV